MHPAQVGRSQVFRYFNAAPTWMNPPLALSQVFTAGFIKDCQRWRECWTTCCLQIPTHPHRGMLSGCMLLCCTDTYASTQSPTNGAVCCSPWPRSSHATPNPFLCCSLLEACKDSVSTMLKELFTVLGGITVASRYICCSQTLMKYRHPVCMALRNEQRNDSSESSLFLFVG